MRNFFLQFLVFAACTFGCVKGKYPTFIQSHLEWTSCIFIGDSLELISYISQHGLHGSIELSPLDEYTTKISTALTTTSVNGEFWKWSIYEFPIDYSEPYAERCMDHQLGVEILNLEDLLGYLHVPDNQTSNWRLDYPILGKTIIMIIYK